MSNNFSLEYAFDQMYLKGMSEKERFTTTLDSELLRQLKILAVNHRCPSNKLLDEAIRDLLKKYAKITQSGPSKNI